MSNILEEQFADLSKEVEDENRDTALVLNRNSVNLNNWHLYSSDLIVKKGSCSYGSGSISIDNAIFYAEKASFRALGLALFAQLFNNSEELIVELTSEDSDVSNIRYRQQDYENHCLDGLRCKATGYDYVCGAVSEYPFAETDYENSDLPYVVFEKPEPNNSRNELRVFGKKSSVANFARLLLDFSLPSNSQPDIRLECYFGITGVADGSTEISLVLPEAKDWWF